jgi:hypothetical protein
MNEDTNLELSFSQTLKESDLKDLLAEISDKALEAAGGVPILGYLSKLWSTSKNVSTYLYAKKIYKFLFELKDVTPGKRMQQIAKMELLTEERGYVGEAVLLLLDKLNEMKKPTMMGRAFKAYLEEKISFDELQSLNHAIEQIFMVNIPLLTYLYLKKSSLRYSDLISYSNKDKVIMPESNAEIIVSLRQLEHNGLLCIHRLEEITTGFSSSIILNNLGRLFVQYPLAAR